jgi:hypothetical protein
MGNMENELTFDEKKTLQVMQAAIATAKRTLLDDGILLMVWGVAFSVSNLWRFYESSVLTVWWVRNLMSAVQWGLGIGAIFLTIWFIFFKKKKGHILHSYFNPFCLDWGYYCSQFCGCDYQKHS